MHQVSHILLVGNGSEHVRLVAAGLAQVSEPNHLTRASTGARALELLEDRERFSRRNPDLILLDLHLADWDAFEILKLLKSSAIYRTIPVVVLSRLVDQSDVRKAYDLHANAFVQKAETLQQTIEVLETICRMWLKVAARPSVSET